VDNIAETRHSEFEASIRKLLDARNPSSSFGVNRNYSVRPPAQDYLADVLTDELTAGLARIRDSFVIARNTAFTYKGKQADAKSVGKDLGVRYVLEGSVQPSGPQVRVNAQLIDAESDSPLWAEQFDTARADLLQMQDDIVTHLAHALEIQLPYLEASRLKRAPETNPNAADLSFQCAAAIQKAGFIGPEAEAGLAG
jgi:TolB-like protein